MRHIDRKDSPELRHVARLIDTELLHPLYPRIDKEEPSRSVFSNENFIPIPHLTGLHSPIDIDELIRQNFLMLRLDPAATKLRILAKLDDLVSFLILRAEPNVVKDNILTYPDIRPVALVLRVLLIKLNPSIDADLLTWEHDRILTDEPTGTKLSTERAQEQMQARRTDSELEIFTMSNIDIAARLHDAAFANERTDIADPQGANDIIDCAPAIRMKDLTDSDDDNALQPITDADSKPGQRPIDKRLRELPMRVNGRTDALEPAGTNPSTDTVHETRHILRIDNEDPKLLKSTTDNLTDALGYPDFEILRAQPNIIEARRDNVEPKPPDP